MKMPLLHKDKVTKLVIVCLGVERPGDAILNVVSMGWLNICDKDHSFFSLVPIYVKQLRLYVKKSVFLLYKTNN